MSQSILLKIREGKLAGEEFIFEENGAYLIGRAPSCAMCVSNEIDGKVSRKHLLMNLSDSGVRIRDVGSRNGTLLNGDMLPSGKITGNPESETPEDRVLHPGDLVTIGDTVWTFEYIVSENESVQTQSAAASMPPRNEDAETVGLKSESAVLKPQSSKSPIKSFTPPPKLDPTPKPMKPVAEQAGVKPKNPPLGLKPKPSLLKTSAATKPTPLVQEKPKVSGNVEKKSLDVPVVGNNLKEVERHPDLSPIKLVRKSEEQETTVELESPGLENTEPKKTPHKLSPKNGNEKIATTGSLAEKDVLEKLGVLDETVEMDSEEFDNLDDLVLQTPERKERKRTTKFKIKTPNS